MKIVSQHLHLPEHGGQWRFYLPRNEVIPVLSSAQLQYRGPHSRIMSHPGRDDLITKLIIPRSVPRDPLRKYANSQALREYRSAQRLAQIGLTTPDVLGFGISLWPRAPYESMLFMKKLNIIGTAHSRLKIATDNAERTRILSGVAEGAAHIYANGLSHRDCHMNNVGFTDSGQFVWIDNDIRRPQSLKRLRHDMHKSLHLLDTTSRHFRRDGEWPVFIKHFENELSQTRIGSKLLAS